ncbi:rho gtpase activation protein [Anaeramoeba flamelloides]|uniref:Rho gtpase activation protein n=1 Tax=Anaeramoeba flamelloides TaxID=1746091 RepID=A0ABQ8Y640_9EUKA|nr:rho gtpase activation protein [Anaeramoeba flamelloides]
MSSKILSTQPSTPLSLNNTPTRTNINQESEEIWTSDETDLELNFAEEWIYLLEESKVKLKKVKNSTLKHLVTISPENKKCILSDRSLPHTPQFKKESKPRRRKTKIKKVYITKENGITKVYKTQQSVLIYKTAKTPKTPKPTTSYKKTVLKDVNHFSRNVNVSQVSTPLKGQLQNPFPRTYSPNIDDLEKMSQLRRCEKKDQLFLRKDHIQDKENKIGDRIQTISSMLKRKNKHRSLSGDFANLCYSSQPIIQNGTPQIIGKTKSIYKKSPESITNSQMLKLQSFLNNSKMRQPNFNVHQNKRGNQSTDENNQETGTDQFEGKGNSYQKEKKTSRQRPKNKKRLFRTISDTSIANKAKLKNHNFFQDQLEQQQQQWQQGEDEGEDLELEELFPLEGFLEENLAYQKPNIFKRGFKKKKNKDKSQVINNFQKKGIHQQLEYTPTTIRNSILKLTEPKKEKIALKLFKYLLFFMGEKKKLSKKFTKKQNSLSAQLSIKYILQTGLKHVCLRDEIYVQIIKQTTKNPDLLSNIRGWSALCLVALTFPPSKELYSHLSTLVEYYTNTTQYQYLAHYVKYARIQLDSIVQKPQTAMRLPSDEKIRRIFAVPYDPIVFNVTLEQCMQNQQKLRPNHTIPYVLKYLVKQIKLTNGLQTEGILRIPGNLQHCNLLKEQLDQGIFEEKKNSMHNPFTFASVLKLWLRELSEPIIPFSQVDQILNANTTYARLQIAEHLPPLNRSCLVYIINFCKQLLDENVVQYTQMNLNAIVLMLAPNLIREKNISLHLLMKITTQRNCFLSDLIQFWDIKPFLLQMKNSEK